jgi:hypothetical protein
LTPWRKNPATSSHGVPVTATRAMSTKPPATVASMATTPARPSATANPMYTVATKVNVIAYRVAAGSHPNATGATTVRTPATTPHPSVRWGS